MVLIRKADGQRYASSGFQTTWQHLIVQVAARGMERLTFYGLRAKTGSEIDDGRLLGHPSRATLERHYRGCWSASKPSSCVFHAIVAGDFRGS
ncbi:MAG TPA: hypothetical protein VF265_10450 [Nevskiaceae bacterium]